jgi:hypothetical protein
LWLFGEEAVGLIDLGVVIEDDAIDLNCPIDSYEEVRTAQRLFPEALIVVGVIPKSILERKPPAAQSPSSAEAGESAE